VFWCVWHCVVVRCSVLHVSVLLWDAESDSTFKTVVVFYGMLQSVLQHFTMCCSVFPPPMTDSAFGNCCRVLPCVTVCCRVLQCAAVCVAVCCSVLQCVAVCCSVLQCVAACCSKIQGLNDLTLSSSPCPVCYTVLQLKCVAALCSVR